MNSWDPSGMCPFANNPQNLESICKKDWTGALANMAEGIQFTNKSLGIEVTTLLDPLLSSGYELNCIVEETIGNCGTISAVPNVLKFIKFAYDYPSWPAISEAVGSIWLYSTGLLSNASGWWYQMDSYLANHLGKGSLWGNYIKHHTVYNWAQAHDTDLQGAWTNLAAGFFKLSFDQQQIALGFMC